MAQLIGGLGTSHIPAIGNAIHKGLQNEPYWKPFFDGFPPIHQWLGEKKPDVLFFETENSFSKNQLVNHQYFLRFF